MNYTDVINYLYNATPLFSKIGAAAYKPGLDTALKLSKAFGEPHRSFPIIHVAGTNGKGSVCHTLAAILQKAGYNVGLYTSPHLINFRERIRVNGQTISEDKVVGFVEDYIKKKLGLSPSFFELTTIMAFDYFRTKKVDVAVVETGLGGRLDTTNIVTPVLSIITNISKDHTAQLGNTLECIASEKAGIIKDNVPVVIGSYQNADIRRIFKEYAENHNSLIVFAGEQNEIISCFVFDDYNDYQTHNFGHIKGELSGECQEENAATILEAIKLLRSKGFNLSDNAVREGFATAATYTGLSGRWMKFSDNPLIICDTGHNEGGWEYISRRLKAYDDKLIMIIGFVRDKDIESILKLLPCTAKYIFCNADIPRALPAAILADKAAKYGLSGKVIPNVADALLSAHKAAIENDMTIFVGGSTFVVADLLLLAGSTRNEQPVL